MNTQNIIENLKGVTLQNKNKICYSPGVALAHGYYNNFLAKTQGAKHTKTGREIKRVQLYCPAETNLYFTGQVNTFIDGFLKDNNLLKGTVEPREGRELTVWISEDGVVYDCPTTLVSLANCIEQIFGKELNTDDKYALFNFDRENFFTYLKKQYRYLKKKHRHSVLQGTGTFKNSA